MKKIILGLSILAIASATTFTACKKDEVKKETVTTTKSISANSRITSGTITPEEMEKILALSDDSVFRELVRIRIMEYNNSIINASGLESVLSAGISAANISTYSSLLGYASTEDFIETTNMCKELEENLEQEYHISSMKSDNLTEAIYLVDPTFTHLPSAAPTAKPGHCQTAYTAAIASIVFNQLVMHLACAGADLTVIGGLVCHGAVVSYGIAQTALADATYAGCH